MPEATTLSVYACPPHPTRVVAPFWHENARKTSLCGLGGISAKIKLILGYLGRMTLNLGGIREFGCCM
jgi:hypothetical protein|tara:strand:+ start:111 stop:314 length:204 start_codon:yes stop_codon:yes gene_type:complete